MNNSDFPHLSGFIRQVFRLLPNFAIVVLDDLGDVAEEEAERRDLIDIETDESWQLSEMSRSIENLDDVKLYLLVENLSLQGQQRLLDAIWAVEENKPPPIE